MARKACPLCTPEEVQTAKRDFLPFLWDNLGDRPFGEGWATFYARGRVDGKVEAVRLTVPDLVGHLVLVHDSIPPAEVVEAILRRELIFDTSEIGQIQKTITLNLKSWLADDGHGQKLTRAKKREFAAKFYPVIKEARRFGLWVPYPPTF